eukprot:SAG31_NODE_1514_length_8042_cov_6.955936_10_plen_224_part_01
MHLAAALGRLGRHLLPRPLDLAQQVRLRTRLASVHFGGRSQKRLSVMVVTEDLQGGTFSISPGCLGAYIRDSARNSPIKSRKQQSISRCVRIWEIRRGTVPQKRESNTPHLAVAVPAAARLLGEAREAVPAHVRDAPDVLVEHLRRVQVRFCHPALLLLLFENERCGPPRAARLLSPRRAGASASVRPRGAHAAHGPPHRTPTAALRRGRRGGRARGGGGGGGG